MKICTHRHQNIVQVLRHDWFNSGSVCFIDMELCNLTLHDYIQNRSALAEHDGLFNDSTFVPENCSTKPKLKNIWTITLHVARALDFIHKMGYVHRDLKPLNGK
jgi:serine/threonine protein kinase